MKKRKTKRLLAGLLALVMVLSLCEITLGQSTPAKAAVSLQNPTIDGNGVTTWDCIYFGNYYQSNSSTKEPIKWRVLSVNGNDAFLLADQNLDAKPYNEEYTGVTWATCTLRTWLNDTFLNTAFISAEQAAIKNTSVVNDDNSYYDTEGGVNTTDKVYLLSIAEVSNTAYGFNGNFEIESETRVATDTAYVASKFGMRAVGEVDWWWLRSPGDSSDSASIVEYGGGDARGGYVGDGDIVVRPALHLNLSSSTLWSYAGKVTSKDGGGSSQVTPKPAATEPPTVISSIVTNKSGNTGKTSSKKTLPKVKLRVLKNEKGKKLVVKWDVVKGAKGYQLQYALNKKFKKKKSVQTKKSKYTIKKLKKKKTYYIRVRAYKMNGKKKVYGKWSKVKAVKRK